MSYAYKDPEQINCKQALNYLTSIITGDMGEFPLEILEDFKNKDLVKEFHSTYRSNFNKQLNIFKENKNKINQLKQIILPLEQLLNLTSTLTNKKPYKIFTNTKIKYKHHEIIENNNKLCLEFKENLQQIQEQNKNFIQNYSEEITLTELLIEFNNKFQNDDERLTETFNDSIEIKFGRTINSMNKYRVTVTTFYTANLIKDKNYGDVNFNDLIKSIDYSKKIIDGEEIKLNGDSYLIPLIIDGLNNPLIEKKTNDTYHNIKSFFKGLAKEKNCSYLFDAIKDNHLYKNAEIYSEDIIKSNQVNVGGQKGSLKEYTIERKNINLSPIAQGTYEAFKTLTETGIDNDEIKKAILEYTGREKNWGKTEIYTSNTPPKIFKKMP